MKWLLPGIVILSLVLLTQTTDISAREFTITKQELRDKIQGAWAAQVIGVTFGGPTEFDFRSTLIPDYMPIPWYDGYMKWWYENAPGLYDDIYMDLTFVQVFEDQGLDAPASAHAKAFAYADYPLWHANQMARYNILQGIMPPESGHWLNNPHADDIDFEIEADFAGIMSPGMPNAAADICAKIGHIMNYGDGWYGGVYVAALYTLAFVSDDIEYVVAEALKVIPEESQYYQVMRDVIRWHRQYPDDWKQTWFEVQRKWGEDIGCPNGVFTTFNIDAKINSAWILLGLLYGEGDFGQTYSISTRAGDDSDCNPGNAGGILGAMKGYGAIPAHWKQGLAEVESLDFKYTTISLKDAYAMSFGHALKMIERNGGSVQGDEVTIRIQEPAPVPLEAGFEGHYPVERRDLNLRFTTEESFQFEGIGFTVTGGVSAQDDIDYTLQVAMSIDGEQQEVTELPTGHLRRKNTPFWKFRLPPGAHQVVFKILNPSDDVELHLNDVIIYENEPAEVRY